MRDEHEKGRPGKGGLNISTAIDDDTSLSPRCELCGHQIHAPQSVARGIGLACYRARRSRQAVA